MKVGFLVTCEISSPCEPVWTYAVNSDGARIYTLVNFSMENTMQIGVFGCQTLGSRSQVKEVKMPCLPEAC